jgi:hypothetical protein
MYACPVYRLEHHYTETIVLFLSNGVILNSTFLTGKQPNRT